MQNPRIRVIADVAYGTANRDKNKTFSNTRSTNLTTIYQPLIIENIALMDKSMHLG